MDVFCHIWDLIFKEDVEKDYSQILKGCIDYLKGICGFQYISICDLHNTEDRLKDLNFKFDSENGKHTY